MHYSATEAPGGNADTRSTRNTPYFRHNYDCEHADMRRLYEQAKIDQWNAATDIDWARPLEGDGGLIADDLVDIHGTKFWDRLSADQRGVDQPRGTRSRGARHLARRGVKGQGRRPSLPQIRENFYFSVEIGPILSIIPSVINTLR
jgi:hypothetical protein